MHFEHRLFSRAEGRLSRVVLTQENQIFGGGCRPMAAGPGRSEICPKNSTGGLPVKRGKTPMRQSAAERGRGRGARCARVGLAE